MTSRRCKDAYSDDSATKRTPLAFDRVNERSSTTKDMLSLHQQQSVVAMAATTVEPLVESRQEGSNDSGRGSQSSATTTKTTTSMVSKPKPKSRLTTRARKQTSTTRRTTRSSARSSSQSLLERTAAAVVGGENLEPLGFCPAGSPPPTRLDYYEQLRLLVQKIQHRLNDDSQCMSQQERRKLQHDLEVNQDILLAPARKWMEGTWEEIKGKPHLSYVKKLQLLEDEIQCVLDDGSVYEEAHRYLEKKLDMVKACLVVAEKERSPSSSSGSSSSSSASTLTSLTSSPSGTVPKPAATVTVHPSSAASACGVCPASQVTQAPADANSASADQQVAVVDAHHVALQTANPATPAAAAAATVSAQSTTTAASPLTESTSTVMVEVPAATKQQHAVTVDASPQSQQAPAQARTANMLNSIRAVAPMVALTAIEHAARVRDNDLAGKSPSKNKESLGLIVHLKGEWNKRHVMPPRCFRIKQFNGLTFKLVTLDGKPYDNGKRKQAKWLVVADADKQDS